MSIPALSSTLRAVRTMDCSRATRALFLARDGLKRSEVAELEAHLQRCPRCRDHAVNCQRLLEVLQSTPRRQAPEDLRVRILRAVRHRRVITKS